MRNYKDLEKRVIEVQISKKLSTKKLESAENLLSKVGFYMKLDRQDDNNKTYLIMIGYEGGISKQMLNDILKKKIEEIGTKKDIQISKIDVPISQLNTTFKDSHKIYDYVKLDSECGITIIAPRIIPLIMENNIQGKLNKVQKQLFYNLIKDNKELKDYIDNNLSEGENGFLQVLNFNTPTGVEQKVDLLKGLLYHLNILPLPKNKEVTYNSIQLLLSKLEIKYEQRQKHFIIKDIEKDEYLTIHDVIDMLQSDKRVNKVVISMFEQVITNHELLKIDLVKEITDSLVSDVDYTKESPIIEFLDFFGINSPENKDIIIYDFISFIETISTYGYSARKAQKAHETAQVLLGESGTGKTSVSRELFSFNQVSEKLNQSLSSYFDENMLSGNSEASTNATKEYKKGVLASIVDEFSGKYEDGQKRTIGKKEEFRREFQSTMQQLMHFCMKIIFTSNYTELFYKGDGQRRFIIFNFTKRIDKMVTSEYEKYLPDLIKRMQCEAEYYRKTNKEYYLSKRKEIDGILFSRNLAYTKQYNNLTYELGKKGYQYDLNKSQKDEQITLDVLDDGSAKFKDIKNYINNSVDYGLVFKDELNRYSIIPIKNSEVDKHRNNNINNNVIEINEKYNKLLN